MLLTRLGASLACWLCRLLADGETVSGSGRNGMENKQGSLKACHGKTPVKGWRGRTADTRTEKRVRGGISLGFFLPRKGSKWLILSYLPRRDAVTPYRVPSAAGVREGACDPGAGEGLGQSRWSMVRVSCRLALLVAPGGPHLLGQRELRTVRPPPHQRSPFGTEPVPTMETARVPEQYMPHVGAALFFPKRPHCQARVGPGTTFLPGCLQRSLRA